MSTRRWLARARKSAPRLLSGLVLLLGCDGRTLVLGTAPGAIVPPADGDVSDVADGGLEEDDLDSGMQPLALDAATNGVDAGARDAGTQPLDADADTHDASDARRDAGDASIDDDADASDASDAARVGQCATDSDCTSAGLRHCQPTRLVCVACLVNSDCNSGQHCEAFENHCDTN